MFFTFDQNNSGGSFDFDAARGISEHVIVEAADAEEANRLAEEIGLYFDGEGDCACCGDRWYVQSDSNAGDEAPSVHGTPVESASTFFKWMGDNPDVFVHYLGGRVVEHHLPCR